MFIRDRTDKIVSTSSVEIAGHRLPWMMLLLLFSSPTSHPTPVTTNLSLKHKTAFHHISKCQRRFICLTRPEMALGPIDVLMTPQMYFWLVFFWRYIRQIVHLVAFWTYSPAEPMATPPMSGKDVTVLIPTIDPSNSHFQATLLSALANMPSKVVITTITSMTDAVEEIVAAMRLRKPSE